ncbi:MULTISPECIES: hypothetical protein [Nostocales]|nr:MULTISPECIES: hypothetical protein [Nostocales]
MSDIVAIALFEFSHNLSDRTQRCLVLDIYPKDLPTLPPAIF